MFSAARFNNDWKKQQLSTIQRIHGDNGKFLRASLVLEDEFRDLDDIYEDDTGRQK